MHKSIPHAGKSFFKYLLIILTYGIGLSLFPSLSSAQEAASHPRWMDALHIEWGGHLRGTAQAAFWDPDTPQAALGPSTAVDSAGELRLMNRTFWGQDTYLQIHYLAWMEHRDSLQTRRRFQELAADIDGPDILPPPVHSEDTQLLDLSHTLHQRGRTGIGHGLDRLNLTLNKSWGTLRLGRQAVSWGNGLIFHPLDLFNPFSPTEVLTDYKAGEDMATAAFPLRRRGELQFLAIPRRTENGSLQWDQSSLAAKMNVLTDMVQVDLMAAHHFDAAILGLGLAGNIGSAGWRTDITWTGIKSQEKYVSAVANLDRSWVWGQKNWYGLLEFYYHGLGEDEPEKALENSDLIQRLNRGEIFVLSTMYLSSALEVEISPLVGLNMTTIFNLNDSSGLIQPTVRWDLAPDLEFIAGATIYAGSQGTEFGGFELNTPGASWTIAPSDSVFAWLTVYF